MSVSTCGTPAVSVVVPLFNKIPYIRRCLLSVLAQTFSDYELIVVDDGSTDGGGDVARSLEDHRIRVVRQENRGAGGARNTGIQHAKGKLIAFLDADDEWMPEFLDAIAGLAATYPEAGIYTTGLRRCLGQNRDLERTFRPTGSGLTGLVTTYFECVHEGDFVTSSNAAIPRSVLDELGSFVEGEPIGEDGDLWARIALEYPIAFDVRILAIYHSEAAQRSFERSRFNPPFPPVVRTLRRRLAEQALSENQRRAVEAYIDWRLITYAYWLLDLQHRDHLLRLFRQERFASIRYRSEARLLQAGVLLFPMRVVSALKWRPLKMLKWCKCILRGGEGNWSGRSVLTRYVPSSASESPVVHMTASGRPPSATVPR